MDARSLWVPVSPGELIDKITILEIKRARLEGDPRRHVETELALLESVAEKMLPRSEELSTLRRELSRINEALWRVEDRIRLCERHKEFGAGFVSLARAVYVNNDQRSALKRKINDLLGSELVEEKAYTHYST